MAEYYGEDQVPVRGRECSSEQMPFIAEKFSTYKAFAEANIDDILGEKKQQSLHYEAQMFESIILERNGSEFSIKKLPSLAQVSPIPGDMQRLALQIGKWRQTTGGILTVLSRTL